VLAFAAAASSTAGPLGAFNDAERLEWWQRALATAFGAGGVAAGLWTLGRAPRSRLTVDASGARVPVVNAHRA
jgi:hypothetical protein